MARYREDVYRPCPCGSGAKYKFCCLEKDRERRHELLRHAPHTVGPDGRPVLFMDLEEGEWLHRCGLELVQQMKAREAIPVLERAIEAAPVVPEPYNNLAMAHFLAGNPERALEICDQVDRVVDPGNVFALGNRIHFLLVLGRRHEAEETGRRMLELPGKNEFAVYKKCEALARLRWHDRVYETATRGLPGARECADGLKFFAGTAAANLARYDVARRPLREARGDRVHGRMARRHLECLARGRGPGSLFEDWPYLEWGHWASPGLLERMTTDEEARKLPGMVEALACLLDEGEEGDMPVRMLGLVGTPEALDVLRRIATGTFGSDELRMKALAELLDRDAADKDEPLNVWLRGRWQEIRPRRLEVTTEAALAVPEDVRDSMARTIEALRAGDWAHAEALGREIVEGAPGNAPAIYNLAMAMIGQGREADAEALLRRAIATDRAYLFAPATLARLLLRRRQTAEARSVLDGVRMPDQAHPEGYVLYLLAQAETSLFEGDVKAAVRAWEGAEQVAPEHPAVREGKHGWARRLAEGLSELERRRRQAIMRRRGRLLAPDAGLEACLADHSLDQLQEMARALDLASASALKKVLLRERLIAALRSPAVVRRAIQSLPAIARQGLDHVRAEGWSAATISSPAGTAPRVRLRTVGCRRSRCSRRGDCSWKGRSAAGRAFSYPRSSARPSSRNSPLRVPWSGQAARPGDAAELASRWTDLARRRHWCDSLHP